MEQSEPVNPRVVCSERTTGCVYDSPVAAEISGYIDIGMKDEALRLTRKVLEKRRILPDEFSVAVRTIGVYGSSFKRWRTKLEAAYNRQSRRFKRKVRADMLGIYASLNDREIAVQFIDVRRPTYPDVLFGMDALLKLNKLEEAQLLASQCAKALRSTTDRFEQSVLLTGLGEYYSRIQRWDDALAAWEHMPLEQPFRRDALSGIVKIHLARALRAIDRGLQALSELKKKPDNGNQLSLPGNDLALTAQAQKELLKFERRISKLLPEKAWKELGIIADT